MTSGDLRNIANGTISVVIALLSLLAIGVLIYGLVRAIMMNRRTQIVVADLITPDDSSELAGSAMLSPVLRQYVRRDTQDQREQTARVGRTILLSASPELEPQLRNGAVDNIQRTANDSIATVSAALRAVVPEQADRFLGLFSALLPPPRGLSVSVAMLERGSATIPRLGAAVDVVWLDGHPLASTTFWENTSPPPTAPRAATSEGVLALLEPISRWVAVRLVVTLLVSPRYHSASRQSQGLRRLLAGGLFLAAMRDFPAHALAFGEQARAELEQARAQMPDMPLPVTTLAGVCERMGWARRAAGDTQQASDEFRAAVGLWQKAQDLTTRTSDPEKLAEFIDRRLKAQLESDHPHHRAAALAELVELGSSPIPQALRSDRVWLYNRACLYAQASEANPDGGYQREALRWLGLALIRDPNAALWDYAARQDPELAPIRGILNTFLINLRSVTPDDPAQINEGDAEEIVANELVRTASSE